MGKITFRLQHYRSQRCQLEVAKRADRAGWVAGQMGFSQNMYPVPF